MLPASWGESEAEDRLPAPTPIQLGAELDYRASRSVPEGKAQTAAESISQAFQTVQQSPGLADSPPTFIRELSGQYELQVELFGVEGTYNSKPSPELTLHTRI